MIIQKIVHSRTASINTQIETCLQAERSIKVLSSKDLLVSKTALEKVRMGAFLASLFKIINLILKFFVRDYKDIDILLESNNLSKRLIQNYSELISNPNAEIDDRGFQYDVSIQRLKDSLAAAPGAPLKVTMVGVEYAGLMKQGGLAEALEGLSLGISNLGHEVHLIFPKYSHLSHAIADDLKAPTLHKNSSGEEYRVYEKKIDGIFCQFIEHPSFQLKLDEPSIYGPDFKTQADRFATFSDLAADLIYEQKNTDVIHLHDWHVAGVGLKLKKEHPSEWEAGDIPPVVFTFHNNQKAMQGRLTSGAYTYDPIVKGYQDRGIVDGNDNLFVRTLLDADAVTTVSESFALESQQIEKGEGISFAVRRAARIGKLAGILNGANLSRWNPATDKTLKTWKNLDTGEPIDLSYGAHSPHLMAQKSKIRDHLQTWVEKYKSDTKIDCSKPLVTYIGRFDSKQKGIDRLEEGIEATLKKGGQFICMGTDEDPTAKEILDRLEAKYKEGVLFLRDHRETSGKLHFQDGTDKRPGIGSLIRASSDFILIPSKFEPCGLVQFEGWQFGSLAIGAKTGGLADSIKPENGFLFEGGPGPTIERALESWQAMSSIEKEQTIRNVMIDVQKSNWDVASKKYLQVYAHAIARKSMRQVEIPTIQSLKYRALSIRSPIDSPEEQYLFEYYIKNRDSAYLSALYNRLPQTIRSEIPSPYGKGVHFTRYETLGSFPDGRFILSAPNAKKVELLLYSDDETQVEIVNMSKGKEHWISTLPSVSVGQKYRYRIDGKMKIDPYARSHIPSKDRGAKLPYSVLAASNYTWGDERWIKQRKQLAGTPQAMSIYEVHPNTWKKQNGQPLSYREFADELLKHCKEQKYTHVELMGIKEYPRDKSWGYQVTGYFAPTTRMGSMDDFKYLVDLLHQNQIGVLLDFVPAHFASESFGLNRFDGSHQYDAHGLKYLFSIRNLFFKYSCKHFDFKKKEVREFLISSAMYWIREMHIDGLRVDCVRSLLNTEDPESAHLFMRDLNATIHRQGDGAITIAEDFSGERSVTASSAQEGLDFDMKWHTGFLHHMFEYFNVSPKQRKHHYDAIVKAISCDDFHKQILFIGHDQAKNYFKLCNKIKDPFKREAQSRSMLSLMMCMPGKKLNFMATEGTPRANWYDYMERKDKGWFDEQPRSPQFSKMVARLNELYRTEKAFFEFDDNGRDIQWVADPNKHLHVYQRKSSDGTSFTIMHNFTDKEGTWKMDQGLEIFNSDAAEFGGQNRLNTQSDGSFKIPPLSTIILKDDLNRRCCAIATY